MRSFRWRKTKNLHDFDRILEDVRAGALTSEAALKRLKDTKIPPNRLLSSVVDLIQETQNALNAGAQAGLRPVGEVLYWLLEPLDQKEVMCMLSGNLGMLAFLEGDHHASVDWLEAAVSWARRGGEPAPLSAALGDLGNAYRNTGRHVEAEAVYREAIETAESVDARELLVNHFTNLAIVYYDLGETDNQARLLRKALSLAQTLKNDRQSAVIKTNLGILYRDQGDVEGAIRFYKEALGSVDKIGQERLRASLMGNLGQAYADLEDREQAIKYYRQALNLARHTNTRDVEANALVGLGNLYIKQGAFGGAEKYLVRAMQISENETLPGVRAQVLQAAADFQLEADGDPAGAIKLLQKATEMDELLRMQLQDSQKGVKIYARLRSAYDKLMDLLMAQGKTEEAFILGERARSTALVRALSDRTIPSYAPNYVTLAHSRGYLPIEEIRNHLRLMGERTVLLSYYLSREHLYAFAMRADEGGIECSSRRINRSRLEKIQENFQREVAEYPIYGDIGESWLELGEWALEPVSDFLRAGDLLFITPHDLLHNLPLHALRLQGQRLLERSPVAYLPAASALPALMDDEEHPPRPVMVAGVYFTEEAEAVADILKAEKRLIAEKLNKDALLQALTEAGLVHISALGYYNRRNPVQSGFVLHQSYELEKYLQKQQEPHFKRSALEEYFLSLSEKNCMEELVQVADLETLQFAARLVVLSACESGLAHVDSAEDPVGMIRALLMGGVRSVMAALWLVNPQTTQDFMQTFYHCLQASPHGWRGKPQALRLAAMDLQRQKLHPYYWAPFVLVGGAAPGAADIQ